MMPEVCSQNQGVVEGEAEEGRVPPKTTKLKRCTKQPEFLNVKKIARADLSFIIFARKMCELGQTNMAMEEQKLQIQCFKEA